MFILSRTRRAPGNFCPESRKENQKGLYRCAIDFQLTLVSLPVSRATSPDLQSAHVALSQVTGILVVRQKKACQLIHRISGSL